MDIRKTVFTREIIATDEMGKPCAPIARAVALAVVRTSFAGLSDPTKWVRSFGVRHRFFARVR